jgi:hypothetical protein
MNNQPQQVPINFTGDDVKGRFSNAAQVSHQQDHFILDFFLAAPPAGQLVGRIILSPSHMKALAKVIDEQIKSYEASYSKIDPAEKSTFGFQTPESDLRP